MTNNNDFWMERPRTMGIRGWSLLVPAIASSVGFFCFGVLAFGFTELSTLSDGFRKALVLTGSFSLAFGGEVGTLSGVVEIYRKNRRLEGWDRFALITSLMSTFGAFVLAWWDKSSVRSPFASVASRERLAIVLRPGPQFRPPRRNKASPYRQRAVCQYARRIRRLCRCPADSARLDR